MHTEAELADLRNAYIAAQTLWNQVSTDRRWERLKAAEEAYHKAVDENDIEAENTPKQS